MNVYMDISIILFLVACFTTTYSVFKETHKRLIKVFVATFLSAISFMIVWRAANIFTYFS